jgi:uncharacterized protein
LLGPIRAAEDHAVTGDVAASTGSLQFGDQSRFQAVGRGLERAPAFGSVARGDSRADSDLDLLYVLAPGRHLGFSINQLEDELAALFGRPVDLVSKAALHRIIRDQVLTEARALHAA